jgi:hypothetical protein
MKRCFPIIFVICIIIISCKKPKVYPVIPSIKFESFRLIDSSDGSLHNHDKFGMLTFSFIDGDGDIGLTESDTIPPFDTSSIYYHDLFIDMFERKNGNYDTVKLLIPLYYRLPYYRNNARDKTVQGRIIIAIQYLPPIQWDTIRYKFFIYDRAKNSSNTVTTPDIILK